MRISNYILKRRIGIKLLFIMIWILTLKSTAQQSPYPSSTTIREIHFFWNTHLRLAPGSDNWPVTWADDNRQYLVWGDGGGFGGTNELGRSSMGVARLEGPWQNFQVQNIWGGYNALYPNQQRGKSYGIVCVEGILYMWVGMFDPDTDPFGEVKVAWSVDHGAHWEFTDWSFTREEGVMMPTVCNYGRDYHGSRDDYVYSYLIRFQSEKGTDDYEDKVDWLNCQKPGMIDLARVPKNRILDREVYTFYAGLNEGEPQWSKDIFQRKPVFEDTDGVGWCLHVSYNSGLQRYLMITEHTETHRGNLGIFDAPDPWGPWTTVYYQSKWGEGHIPLNTFYWSFANKWLSQDGKTFSLIFTGRKENDSFNLIRGEFLTFQ